MTGDGTSRCVRARRARRDDAVIALVLMTLAAGSFLFPPRALREERFFCARYVPVGAHAGIVVNCDSLVFMRLATAPGRLLEPGNRRQSRPLYVAAGAVITRAFASWLPAAPVVTSPAFVAFVVVNAVVLGLAVFGFLRLLAGLTVPLVAVGCAALLVANDVVRLYFWTPHTQMFLVLVPVLCMLADRAVRVGSLPGRGHLLGLGLGSGALVLAYGSGVLVAVSAAIGLVVHHRRVGTGLASRRVAGDIASLLGGLLVLPVGWFLVILATTGSFYSDEVGRFRQFVWLADAWSTGALGERVTVNLSRFASYVAETTWPAWALLAAATALAAASGVRPGNLGAVRGSLIGVATTTLALTGTFFGLLGTYNWRLAWAVSPPLLALAAVVLDAAVVSLGARGRPAASLLLGAAVLWSWLW